MRRKPKTIVTQTDKDGVRRHYHLGGGMVRCSFCQVAQFRVCAYPPPPSCLHLKRRLRRENHLPPPLTRTDELPSEYHAGRGFINKAK